MKRKDYTGQKFGMLTAIKYDHLDILNKNDYRMYWLFQCDCGNKIVKEIRAARRGHKSCGCSKQVKIAKNRQNLTGKKFDKLYVTGNIKHGKTNKILLRECLCDCGNIIWIPTDRLNSGNTKSCGCLYHRQGNKHPNFRGFQEIGGTYWADVKNNAKKRSIDFNITIEEAWSIFIKQNRKCALSGIDINFTTVSNTKEATASLDRIDSNKDYSINNCQWVHKVLNKMKLDLDQKYFITWCKLVSLNN